MATMHECALIDEVERLRKRLSDCLSSLEVEKVKNEEALAADRAIERALGRAEGEQYAERNRRDAERYRYLRINMVPDRTEDGDVVWDVYLADDLVLGEHGKVPRSLDDAIDLTLAALAKNPAAVPEAELLEDCGLTMAADALRGPIKSSIPEIPDNSDNALTEQAPKYGDPDWCGWGQDRCPTPTRCGSTNSCCRTWPDGKLYP